MPEARGRGSARRQGRAAGPQRMRPGPATMARSRSCREPEESIGTRAPEPGSLTLTGMPPLDLLIVSDSHFAALRSDDTVRRHRRAPGAEPNGVRGVNRSQERAAVFDFRGC